MQITDELLGADFCVIGGGMAGYCAALTAAREGAHTIIVHNRPVFGGCGSTEIRVPFSGAGSHNPSANETGLILELITEERAQNPDPAAEGCVNAAWDIILYDKVRQEPNLQALLNAHVFAVDVKDASLEAVYALQLDTERVWRIEASFYCDATGDGVVGAAAGVPFRIGQEASWEYGEALAPPQAETWTLGSSLLFKARDCGRPMPFTPPSWAARYPTEESLQYRPHGRISSGYWWIEVGYPYDSIKDNEAIRDELLRHLLGVWDHIKNYCLHKEQAANYVLEWIGMLPARRESRRFIGAHVLTQTEICRRELFADRVAYGGWIIDDHTKGGILAAQQAPSFHDTGLARYYVAPYSIPLRSLYSAHIHNLFFAGRCMSASRLAFNSLRVQRTLALCGQSVGTAAAYCAKTKQRPQALQPSDMGAIQQSLLRQDCWIPRVRNEDEKDLARHARVTATSTWTYEAMPEQTKGLPLDNPLACLLPLDGHSRQIRLFVRNEEPEEKTLRGTLHKAEDIWDLDALEHTPSAFVTFLLPGKHIGALQAALPALPQGLYWLKLEAAKNVIWLQQKWAPPGITSAHIEEGRWAFAPGIFSDWHPLAADVLPASCAYEPENVINGVSRPEQWPNVWLSAKPAPQALQLDLAEPAFLRLIQISWGLNFHRSYFQMPGGFRAPECARDYRVIVRTAEQEEFIWAEVRNNYQRFCRHAMPQALSPSAPKITSIRIEVLATNGAERVEIDEIRVY